MGCQGGPWAPTLVRYHKASPMTNDSTPCRRPTPGLMAGRGLAARRRILSDYNLGKKRVQFENDMFLKMNAAKFPMDKIFKKMVRSGKSWFR
jgi:hypothetical protein